jgi:hypothetical protein
MMALRKICGELVAIFEDYLDTPHDESLLYRRRKRKEIA